MKEKNSLIPSNFVTGFKICQEKLCPGDIDLSGGKLGRSHKMPLYRGLSVSLAKAKLTLRSSHSAWRILCLFQLSSPAKTKRTTKLSLLPSRFLKPPSSTPQPCSILLDLHMVKKPRPYRVYTISHVRIERDDIVDGVMIEPSSRRNTKCVSHRPSGSSG